MTMTQSRPLAAAAATQLTMAGALTAAMRDAMTEDASVVVFGEDVGPLGGVFRVTDGLSQQFGDKRRVPGDDRLAQPALLPRRATRCLLPADRGVRVPCRARREPARIFGRPMSRLAHRLGDQLRFAASVHQHEPPRGLVDGLPRRENAVSAMDRHSLVTESACESFRRSLVPN